MAKKSKSYSLKGTYDFNEGTVTEINKDVETVYSLEEILREFHGREVSISVKEDSAPEPIGAVEVPEYDGED